MTKHLSENLGCVSISRIHVILFDNFLPFRLTIRTHYRQGSKCNRGHTEEGHTKSGMGNRDREIEDTSTDNTTRCERCGSSGTRRKFIEIPPSSIAVVIVAFPNFIPIL